MRRRGGILATAVAVLLAAVTGCAGSGDEGGGGTGAVEEEASPAAEQLAWVLSDGATAGEADLQERFAPSFLEAVPLDQLGPTLASLGAVALLEVRETTATRQVALVRAGDGTELVATIEVEPAAPHRIVGLLFQPAEPPPAPMSWEEVDARLDALAPRIRFLAAELDGAGAPVPVHGREPGTSGPIGSVFKLYVLGAVAEAVERGELGWDDPVTVEEADRSLPSGQLQDRVGETLPLREVVLLMLSISDNTATDLLMRLVGRDAVEARLAPMGLGGASAARTRPFLSTREAFRLKLGDAAVLADYVAADEAGRRDLLQGLPAGVPDLAAVVSMAPTEIDTVEWFASPSEVVAAHVHLDEIRRRPGLEPVGESLSANPGVRIDAAAFPYVAFKGGSEPGVLAFSFLLERSDGRRFAVVLLASDPAGPIDTLDGVAIVEGAISLLAAA